MYNEYNPNPVKSNRVDDCSVRALTKALNIDWETAYLMLASAGYSMGDMMHSNDVIGAVLRKNGFKRDFPPSNCPDCFTVERFCTINPEGNFVVFSQNHVASVIDGSLYDSWDSGGNTILFVWYKGEEPAFEIIEEQEDTNNAV